jgi:hypothetical protein
VVQCQRTRLYLRDSEQVADDTWRCPHCPEHEEYVRVADPGPLEAVSDAVVAARAEFERPDDGIPTVAWLGTTPETVYEAGLDTYHVYLTREANPLQVRYQAAHEAVHRVCGPPNTHHWTRELLAVMFSLRYLRWIGLASYAAAIEAGLQVEAGRLPLSVLLREPERTSRDGIYGQVFVLGSTLEAIVGWPRLRALADAEDRWGRPHPEGWLRSLPPDQQLEARVVLAVEASAT